MQLDERLTVNERALHAAQEEQRQALEAARRDLVGQLELLRVRFDTSE